MPANLGCGAALFLLAAGVCSGAEVTPALFAPTNASTAGFQSSVVGLSPDGRHVLFLSRANDLVEGDNQRPMIDVFLRDRSAGVTRLVSVANGVTGGGNSHSGSPAVSADGRWVAFESTATDLTSDDRQNRSDIYLRDVAEGTTRLVSASREGGPGNRASFAPQISADGRYVVFESLAGDLIPGETNGVQEIFRAEPAAGRVQRVSWGQVFPGNPGFVGGPAQSFALTPDAGRIVYVRQVTNVFGRIVSGEVFGWDAGTSNTVWLSAGVLNNDQTGIPAACTQPAISGDGRYVVFMETNSAPAAALYRQSFDVSPGVAPTPISRDAILAEPASVSRDGQWIAFEAIDGIHLWNGQTGADQLILGHLASPARRVCSKPVLSASGERLAFYVSSNGVSALQVYNRATGEIRVVANHEDSPVAVNEAQSVYLSADGQTIAFNSPDSHLVDNDLNGQDDVFAASGGAGPIECVSVRATSAARRTPAASSSRWPGSMSADGRILAISSFDLGGADTNGLPDLRAHNRTTGTAQFIGQSSNSAAYPSLSADGRYLAYLSLNLPRRGAFESQPSASVHWRDLRTGEDRLVHSSSIADSAFSALAMSPDGRKVAFLDRNTIVVNSFLNLYLWDADSGSVALISEQDARLGPPAQGAQGDCVAPRFSPDGRWLLFVSSARNLTLSQPDPRYGLFARDLERRETKLLMSVPASAYDYAISADSKWVASQRTTATVPNALGLVRLESGAVITHASLVDGRQPSLSADGRYLAYDDRRYSSAWRNIVVFDSVAQTTALVTEHWQRPGESVPRIHSSPAITADSRYVVFASLSSNLIAGDINGLSDIFVRDRHQKTTLLLSLNLQGTGPANGPSILPIIAANGRTVLFQSAASDLFEGDANETLDTFTVELGGPDTDRDGLDDSWEMAYFNTLDRDGNGDFDGDQVNDRAEYEAGTDPTNRGSVLQVMTLTRLGGNQTRLIWSAVPGRNYRVQFRDELGLGIWTDAPAPVTAAGTTATWLDPFASATGRRFYRVVAEAVTSAGR